jgi:hypothetical protein
LAANTAPAVFHTFTHRVQVVQLGFLRQVTDVPSLASG